MDALLAALAAAVETRELDLGDLSEIYIGVKLPYRVNWTRGQKKARWTLARELGGIQKALKGAADGNGKLTDEETEALNERAEANAAGWMTWWAEALQMTPDEVERLRDALPAPHWEWITAHIIQAVYVYEAEETKKVHAAPGSISTKPDESHPNSTSA